jgi:bifunctional pyridoxal-dependent enzyme with beta-cystathionase and maltose regulon repressor activities
MAKRFIDEGDVSMAPGCAFGKDSKGWIRLCFAVSREKLAKALDRIEKVIGE